MGLPQQLLLGESLDFVGFLVPADSEKKTDHGFPQ